MKFILSFSIVLLSSNIAFAWGERGHHMIGETAARMVDEHMSKHSQFENLGRFYQNRALQMGHLNNIPDISWKSQSNPTIKTHNGPCHYIDHEHFFGFPEKSDNPEFLEKIRKLPTTHKGLRDRYDGKEHPTKKRPLKTYTDSGSNPYRIGELFERSKKLMKCASQKVSAPFQTPIFPLLGSVVVENTDCSMKTGRLEALLGSVTLAGMMGHFVADLSQPQHNSADHNGWMTGQGGLHSYFETEIVHAIGDNLMDLINKKVAKYKKDRTFEKRLGSDWKSLGPVELALRLSADAYSNLNKLQELDRKYSLIKKSQRNEKDKVKILAKRKDPYSPEVWKKYESFTVDRMTMSTMVLAHMFGQIWEQGGKPDIANVVFFTKPYPLDSAFIMPNYRPSK